MAQAALKTCEMCISSPGSHYCLDCCQYFCDNCKSMHTRVKLTKNHKFESASNVIPEVKSQCIEHNESFVFVCTSCDVQVCIKCIAGKHNGHKVGNIADIVSCFKKEFTNDIKTKLDAATKTVTETENGLKTFDNNIKSAINDIKEEGRKLKAMIDRQVAEMIKTLKEKAALEKDKLSNIVSDTKNDLERCREFEIQNDQLQTAREDADLIKKLKGLMIESEKVKVGAVPKLPSVNISKATVTDKNIIKLFGTYSISETKLMTTGIVTDNITRESNKKEQQGSRKKPYLYTSEECGETKLMTTGIVTDNITRESNKKKQQGSRKKPYLYTSEECGDSNKKKQQGSRKKLYLYTSEECGESNKKKQQGSRKKLYLYSCSVCGTKLTRPYDDDNRLDADNKMVF